MEITSRMVLVKKGRDYFPFDIDFIVGFSCDDKTVYVHLNNGERHIAGKSLVELETLLNKQVFVRVSRKWLINMNYIRNFTFRGEQVEISMESVPPIPIPEDKFKELRQLFINVHKI